MTDKLVPSSQVNFGSKWAYVKPATVTINQPTTDVEGAVKGQFRVVETGEQFNSITAALLVEPQERRDYQEGKYPELKRVCWSRDMIRPDSAVTTPQALTCNGCPKSDWTPWREYKEKTGQSNVALIPQCQPQYYIVMVDTQTKLPLQMYVKGVANRKNFESGMSNVAREIFKLRSQGLTPQYYDVKFTLITEKNGPYYNLKIINVKAITEEERASFGDVYLNFISRINAQQSQEEQQAQAEQEVSNTVDVEITNAVSDDVVDGDYIQI